MLIKLTVHNIDFINPDVDDEITFGLIEKSTMLRFKTPVKQDGVKLKIESDVIEEN